MTTANITSSSSDGYLAKTYTLNYNNARDAASATTVYDSNQYILIGYGSAPALFRGFLYFNTATIPANSVISAASVSVYVPSSCPAGVSGGQDMLLQNGQPTYPSSALDVGDFDRTLYSSGGSSKINVTGGDNEWKIFTLTATGIEWINKGGVTKLCLRGEFDISPTIPTSNMEMWIYASEHGSLKPTLSITYTLKPLITTDAATGLGPTYVTGNGTVDSQGDGSVVEYGFIYNDDGTDPVDVASADNKTTSSNLSAGSFSASLTSLENAFTYNYRAYMTTSIGTGYGDAVEFTTSAAAAVLSTTTVSATDTDVETATLNGSVSRPAGDLVEEYGFVYKLGGDPGTPADPTTADNYTETSADIEGAFDDDLTGLTSDSQYMFRAYATSDLPDISYGGVQLFRTGGEIAPIVIGASSDGYIKAVANGALSESARWNLAHDDDGSGNADCTITKYSTSDTLRVGLDTFYEINRAYLYFDTSSIPVGATIAKAQICVYMTGIGHADTNTRVMLISGQSTYPHDPLVADSDYHITHYSGTYGEWQENRLSGFGQYYADTYGFIDITTPDSIVNKGGMTKLCLSMYDDWDDQGSWATKSRMLTFRSASYGASTAPRLEIFLTGADKDCSFYSETGDGTIKNDTSGCETIANPSETLGSLSVVETSSSSIDISGSWTAIGCGAGKYNINTKRGYVYFDTSGIPAGAVISDATIWLYCSNYSYDGASNVRVYHDSSNDHPSESGGSPNLSLSDWPLSNYSHIATVALSDMMTDKKLSSQNGWTRTAIPTTSITKEGLTKFCLRDDSESDADDSATFYSGNSATNKPYLLVNWSSVAEMKTPQINIGDTWKDVEAAQINIGDSWKDVDYILINVGDEWKPLAS